MVERLRILPSGSDSILIELRGLEPTLRLLDHLRALEPEGIVEIIPAARTLMLRFDPAVTDRKRLTALLAQTKLPARSERAAESFDIPVRYDGEDLGAVAEHLGWSVEELIRRHSEADYTVAFAGFAPGFAYLTSDDPDFEVPRRKSPRLRIPAGSVAVAGRFSGVYPGDSPGGWQLLGMTSVKMWDTSRPRAALLVPGDRVRFRDVTKGPGLVVPAPAPKSEPVQPREGLSVIRADRPALFQDMGRPGYADQGVGEAGPMDRGAALAVNRCLGNPRGAAVVEVLFGGFALRADRPVTLAVTGAPCPLTIRANDGSETHAPFARPFALDAGDRLELGTPERGMYSYLGLRGGFDAPLTLGSAATDTLSRIGPAPLQAGDRLPLANRPARAVDPDPPLPVPLPRVGDVVTVDVVPGPRADWFTEAGLAALAAQDWLVTPESSRIGIRLSAETPIRRRDQGELASEATAKGAIQVPHSGQPVLFLADHPLTGGYPVIAVVARHHLDLAAQVPVGARIRFNPVAAFDPQEIKVAAAEGKA